MTDAAATTDLVPIEEYAIANRTDEQAAVMRENVGEGGMTVFDLDRVKVPAGGGKSWALPTLEGGEESVRSIEGVIVAWRDPRAFWLQSLDESGGGAPPDCSSDDGKRGYGAYGVGSDLHPSGDCRDCPMSKWGTAKNGESRGQACKQMRLLFILRKDDLLPVALFAPPTSIGPLRKYFLRLANRSVPYYAAVTRLDLEETGNKDGIKFSRVVPSLVGRLDAKDVDRVRAYAEGLQDTLDQVRIEQRDVANTDAARDDLGGDAG